MPKTTKKSAVKKSSVKKKVVARKVNAKKKNVPKKTAARKTVASLANKAMLAAGQPAPEFTLPNDEGQLVSLADYRGQKVVLYFYPEDDTPGCTKEACSFRDGLSELHNHRAVVLGLSADSVESHVKFKRKFHAQAFYHACVSRYRTFRFQNFLQPFAVVIQARRLDGRVSCRQAGAFRQADHAFCFAQSFFLSRRLSDGAFELEYARRDSGRAAYRARQSAGGEKKSDFRTITGRVRAAFQRGARASATEYVLLHHSAVCRGVENYLSAPAPLLCRASYLFHSFSFILAVLPRLRPARFRLFDGPFRSPL